MTFTKAGNNKAITLKKATVKSYCKNSFSIAGRCFFIWSRICSG